MIQGFGFQYLTSTIIVIIDSDCDDITFLNGDCKSNTILFANDNDDNGDNDDNNDNDTDDDDDDIIDSRIRVSIFNFYYYCYY